MWTTWNTPLANTTVGTSEQENDHNLVYRIGYTAIDNTQCTASQKPLVMIEHEVLP